jgi:hypothetical protein
MYAQWDAQMPALVQEYLSWKHGHRCPDKGGGPSDSMETSGSEQVPGCHEFEVTVIRTYGKQSPSNFSLGAYK